MRRQDLEQALRTVPPFPSPQAALEQVPTPPEMAARLLLDMAAEGDLDGRVLDLGCGTGMLAYGAHLMGATVTGVDIDADAVAIAKAMCPGTFIVADVREWQATPHDAVIMNPPFGAQSKHADRPFYDKAAQAVGRAGPVYFFALAKTEGFLRARARELGASLHRLWSMDLPIPATHAFHDADVKAFDVGAFVMDF